MNTQALADLLELAMSMDTESHAVRAEIYDCIALLRQAASGGATCKDCLQVPDGWVLVPREPTREMLYAGMDEADGTWEIWEAMLDAAPALPAAGWLPIESAPRDGTMVDLWADGRYPNCKWMISEARDTGDEEWCRLSWHTTFDDWFWMDIEADPTHWREPPAPPAGEG